MKKVQTLCMIYNDDQILLGMKKRGFGEGKWNGFGGKVQEGESIEEAMLRELREEAGIELLDSVKRGVIIFRFEEQDEYLEVHVFSGQEFTGELFESEEMKPQWFDHDKIPFDSMWADDPHWVPHLLEGKNFNAEFKFRNFSEILYKEINII